MACHTWFFRPTKENEIAKDTCEYSYETFGEDKYTDIDTPHDLFRIGGYPDDKLLSLQQTMEFIKLNKEQMSFCENWEEISQKVLDVKNELALYEKLKEKYG